MVNSLQFIPLLFVVLVGLIAGSFVSVLIYRIPKGESIVFRRSHCRSCQRALGVVDLIPVVSFLLQNGRCRYCKATISPVYPIIEIVTALLFMLAYWLSFITYNAPPVLQAITFLYFAILFVIFAALFFIDLFELLLPDVLVFSALLLVFLYNLVLHSVEVFVFQSSNDILRGASLLLASLKPFSVGLLAGFLVALFFFLLIIVTRGKGMGGGDVKFALVMGAVTGWPKLLAALFLAFFLGAVVSVVLLLLRKKHFGQTIPFGPFLIIGTLLTLVWGDQLLEWFLYGNHLSLL